MKNKFNICIIGTFLCFCFIIFYKGLNNSNTYTPKIDDKKIYLFLKPRISSQILILIQKKSLKKIVFIL